MCRSALSARCLPPPAAAAAATSQHGSVPRIVRSVPADVGGYACHLRFRLLRGGTDPVPYAGAPSPRSCRPAGPLNAAPCLVISRLAATEHRALSRLHRYQLHRRFFLLKELARACGVGGGRSRQDRLACMGVRAGGGGRRRAAGECQPSRRHHAPSRPLQSPTTHAPGAAPLPSPHPLMVATGAHPRNKEVNCAVGVTPDLRPRGGVVNLRVGCGRRRSGACVWMGGSECRRAWARTAALAHAFNGLAPALALAATVGF